MEFYLFILIILFCTALADLVVGVANDAVNFLNSAIGSKAGSRLTIMIVASLGVLVGTTFSSGIMEVARKGIFNPEFFTFHEVMIIFLAVMLTDILLLDLFNTFGLPTSTTVSIVFEILGGAMAIALVNVLRDDGGLTALLEYINTENVLTIISSIGLSIIFAFVFGALIQFLTRVLFTFDYEKTFRKIGALYCGAALSLITYFILVKGVKGSSLITPETAEWIKANMGMILGISFLSWTVFWQLIISLTKIKVLRIIVLIGTFALALAFAANDLVNFIGAPLGALAAYKIGAASGSESVTLTMEALRNPVKANTAILLLAGGIMVVTLWISRKARSVTKTEVNLGRQHEGVERFEASPLSRGIVRMGIAFFDILKQITPARVQARIRRRINPATFSKLHQDEEDPPAFDHLRAAVNLMVASALISFGTSLKLPLSTTFVTFMVAMSTSLADRSWGRESAVYRVNGVITVIGGWFFTAAMAFSACFVFALFIYFVKLPAIIILMGLGFYFYFRMTKLHQKREAAFEQREQDRLHKIESLDTEVVIKEDVAKLLEAVISTIESAYKGLIKGDRKLLKSAIRDSRSVAEDGDHIVAYFLSHVSESDGDGRISRFAKSIGNLRGIASNLALLSEGSFEHIDNNHSKPDGSQASDLAKIRSQSTELLSGCRTVLRGEAKDKSEQIATQLAELKQTIEKLGRAQIKRIRRGKSGTRQGLMFINTISKTERIVELATELLDLLRKKTL